MAKFKVGDKVKLVKLYNPTNEQAKHLHKVGTVVDVDTGWRYPYEVDFDNENLYCDYELELVVEEPIVEEKEEELIEAIRELSKRVNNFAKNNMGTRETAMILTKLDEARLWAREFNTNYGHRFGNLKWVD